ncbi:MAG: hypothetical protein Q8K98_12665 [Bacteroidota bacterium]|nr:hypothetical protein [Bacteroidota bacterium]
MKHFLAVIIFVAVTSLTGCMMMGGMMHKMDDDGHKEMSEKLIKEVEINDYRITAEFPALFYKSDALFGIKIYSLKDSMTSTASVRLMISEFGHEIHSDAVQFDRDLYKDSDGNYSTTYLVKTKKDIKVSYLISELEDVVLKKPVEIEAQLSIHTAHKQHGGWMHDIGPYAIIGGVVMLTMMVFMVGRVF